MVMKISSRIEAIQNCLRRIRFLTGIVFLLIFFSIASFADPLDADDDAENSSKDSSQVYHVFGDVYLLSALKITYGKPKLVIKAVYPQLQSDSDDIGTITTFNQIVMDYVKFSIWKKSGKK